MRVIQDLRRRIVTAEGLGAAGEVGRGRRRSFVFVITRTASVSGDLSALPLFERGHAQYILPRLVDNVAEVVGGSVRVLHRQRRLFSASKEVLVGVFVAVAAAAGVVVLKVANSPHPAARIWWCCA